MRIPPKIRTLLGFATKSRKLVTGDSAVESGLKRGVVQLVLLAEDLPPKRRSYWELWCKDEGIPCITLGSKQEFGDALGMSPRSIIAVKDKQMAAALNQQVKVLLADTAADNNGGD